MNMYRTALSALLLTPIIGGMGVKMIQGYQNAAKAAENFVTESEKQMEQTNALFDEIFDETSDSDISIDILSEDIDIDDINVEDIDIDDISIEDIDIDNMDIDNINTDNIQDDGMIIDDAEKLQIQEH